VTGVPDFDTALDELDKGPAPTDFADLALRYATRHARRTRILTVAGAAALIAVLGLTAVTLHPLRARHTTPAAAPQSKRMAVLSYQMYTRQLGVGPSYAWDPGSHAYISTASPVQPSPDGRWGMVIGPQGVGIALWADAIRQRNLSWKQVTGKAKWSPTGHVIVADLTHKRTTWIVPGSMATTTVAWPPALRNPEKVVSGFGGLATDPADDVVVYWTYDRDRQQNTTILWTNRAGQVLRTSHVVIPPLESMPLAGSDNDQASPSPDGRYVNLMGGLVVDTQRQRILYEVTRGVPTGWYAPNTVVLCTLAENGKGMVITPYLVTGPPLTPTAPTALPGYTPGSGAAKLYVAAAGPDTDGAVTF
jgi:hypothetical protein